MRAGETVDGSADADCVAWASPIAAFDRQATRHAAIDIGNIVNVERWVRGGGLKTGNGNRWTRERVTSMRSNYRIAVFKPAEDGIEPWLNLSNAAQILKIAPRRSGWRLKRERSNLFILCRMVLGSSSAPLSQRPPLNPSPNGRGKTQSTPQDRVPTSKTSSHQSHSQMGVPMQGCRSRGSGRSRSEAR